MTRYVSMNGVQREILAIHVRDLSRWPDLSGEIQALVDQYDETPTETEREARALSEKILDRMLNEGS